MRRNGHRPIVLSARHQLDRLGSFGRGLLAMAGALAVWVFLDCFQVAVGLDREALRTSVGRLDWHPDPSYGMWLLALLGPALACLRLRIRPGMSGGTGLLSQRLRTFAALVTALACRCGILSGICFLT